MIDRLRCRLSYSNVVATLALFIALGGTSYALTLPRDSVGSREIRTRAVGASEIAAGAVRSSDIRDRSVGVRDISIRARRSLRGQRGALGPAGPAGPPGAPGVTYRAAINAGGGRVRGNAVRSNHVGANNEYRIAFERSVAECVSTATLARVEGGSPEDPPPGRIIVARDGGEVLVRTYDASGAPAELPFHLLVAC